MRQFVYFSRTAVTSGNALSKRDLMRAGRMDIAIHSFIQGVFLSHAVRDNVIFHFIFYGMPDPPKHIEIHPKPKKNILHDVKDSQRLDISKKDVGNLIKKILYKYKEGEKKEVFPGCFIEKKSFLSVVEDLINQGNEIYVLDKDGIDIREIEISKNCVFIFGDHKGLPQKEIKRLLKFAKKVSIGPKMYFASQTVAVVNNELDRREI